ncbi:DUF1097 domain-containing protein [Eubacterium barkeri]|uniref:DUF1097 domain-containing protein n=1 Tax=Eubacterium barkeri TaxID=1528 RepID=A0A1H3K0M0_EUBBA|nr:DUF1097 domain-containing protein [Eubacterium barkeri]SDY45753.1 Protein of unknown function [Eubacterium barkeri]
MKLEKIDVSVSILAALACIFATIQVPVWAIFVGWAWYFALGSTPDLIKKSILPTFLGSILAVLAFILIDWFGLMMPALPALALAVLITVFLLMLGLKIPACGLSLVAFNAYSCLFVGYGANAFMVVPGIPALLNAVIWISGANILGLLFGYLSIKLTTIGAKDE